MKDVLVIIDAGHGSLDYEGNYVTPGKRSPLNWNPKIFEGVLNRAQSNLLNYMLSTRGIRSHIVAPENVDVGINTRVNRVNACHKNELSKKRDCFGISIHSNYAGTEANPITSAAGWEIFTGIKEDTSDKIAEYFKDAVIKHDLFKGKLRLGSSGSDKDTDVLGMLKYTTCPFVLTEDGFMSNYNPNATEGDYKDLIDMAFITRLVQYKVFAIEKIIKELYK